MPIQPRSDLGDAAHHSPGKCNCYTGLHVHLFIALFLFLGCSESPQSKNVPSDSIILIDKIFIRLENAKKEMKEESERLLNSEDAKQFQEIGKKFRTSDGNKSILSKSEIEFLEKMKKQNTRAHNIQQKYILNYKKEMKQK